MARAHGGSRAGSGRKPAREKYAGPVARAEKQIADRLPDLVEKLFAMADAGDYRAASYLLDRIMGKPPQAVEADVKTDGKLRIVVDYADPGTADHTAEAASGSGESDPGSETL